MSLAAYERARKLLDTRPGRATWTYVLGALEAVLLLLLFLGVALLFAAVDAHGESGLGTNLGLQPLVTRNASSPYLNHTLLARGLNWCIDTFPALGDDVGAIALLLMIGLTLVLLVSATTRLRRGLIADASTHVAANLRRQLHRQIYRLGQSALPSQGIQPVLNLFTREVNDVRHGLFEDLNRIPRTPILVAGCLLIALSISIPVTLFLACLGTLVWLVTQSMQRNSNQVLDIANRDAALQLSMLHEDLSMLRTVRVFGMEEVDKERFDEHLERYREADSRRLSHEWKLSPGLLMLTGAAVSVALGLLSLAVLRADRLSLSSILIVSACLVITVAMIDRWKLRQEAIRRAGRSAAGLFEYMERKPELLQTVGAFFLPPLKERISFQDVTIEGDHGRDILENVSVDLEAGTRVAVVGLDEESKFALVSLIPRLIDPKKGRVLIDGRDLREVTLESIRAQVATVFQNDLVFTDSVGWNISLGDPSFQIDRIVEAAKAAHAHQFIQDLPMGYDTIIGPIGQYLSNDQLYRIALARVFLSDPSIVIIEESSAPMSDEVKALIDDSIGRLSRGRTLIFLPHRLSTIRSCRQVIVLHEGRVEDHGPYRELHHRSKLFRHLQYIEFNQFSLGGELDEEHLAR